MVLSYTFSAALWEYGGEASWVFVTLPQDDADEIAEVAPRRPGFGSIKVTATIGSTEWSTSLFPSKGLSSYVMPVKRAVRNAEGLDVDDTARVEIHLHPDW